MDGVKEKKVIKTDGIIFDMDGTIWDNTELFAASWNKAARELGYETAYTAKDLQRVFGRTMTDIADAIIPDLDPQTRYRALEYCEEVEMRDLMESPVDTTYHGLEETLETLSGRMGIPLYIVSNCQAGYIECYFEKAGHGKYFKGRMCFGDNGLGKADNLRLLIKEQGLKAPVYVGDIQRDKDACDQAKVPFIWASYGYGRSVDGFAARIDDIRELAEVVEKA